MVPLKDGRCRWGSIVEHCVLSKRFDPGGYDRAALRRAQKDVSGYFWRTVEPVRIIECATIDAVYCRKSFQIEVELRPTGRAKIDGDPLSAALRGLREGGRFACSYRKRCFLENRLDHVSRSGCSLAESAMAIGNPYRLSAGGVPDCTAKTTTLVSKHVDPHQEHTYGVAAPPLVSKRCGGLFTAWPNQRRHACATGIEKSHGRLGSDGCCHCWRRPRRGNRPVLCKASGLKAVLLEKQDTVGGLWAQLPAWQDIQNRAEDWTLGDLPIAGVDQPSILANIQQWVHKFDLGQHIRLGTTAISASPTEQGWTIETAAGELRAKALISATGVHNRPIIPDVERSCSDVPKCTLQCSATRLVCPGKGHRCRWRRISIRLGRSLPGTWRCADCLGVPLAEMDGPNTKAKKVRQ